jgi:hypothetical protein
MNTSEAALRREDPIAGEEYHPLAFEAMLARVMSTESRGGVLGRFRLGTSRILGAALATSVVGVAFFAGAEFAGASAAPHQAAVLTCADGSKGTPNWATVQAADQLNRSLEANFPDQYSGIGLSNCNADITVYVTAPSSALENAVTAVAPPGSASYAIVPNSLAQLLAVQRSLESDWEALLNEGMQIEGFGTNIPSNVETIEVVSPTSVQIAELNDRYGAGLIQVVPVAKGEFQPAPFVTPLKRR